MDLSNIFGKFAGKEVPLKEEHWEIKIGDGKEPIKGVDYKLANENDPVLKEMHKVAAENGLSLRVMWPGMMTTMDFRTDRANANIEKAADGKWRIANSFGIG